MDYTRFIIVFIAFALSVYWLMTFLYKINLPTKIYNKFPSKFLDQLTDCEFCMETHISIISTICLFFTTGSEEFLCYAFMTPALLQILKK